MYESFLGLHARPFAAAPLTWLYYPAKVIDESYRSLIRLVEREEGVGMIVGAAGTGKTLLCQLLAEYFRDRFATVLLSSGRLTSRRSLLQHILFELKLPYRQMDEGELRLTLLDFVEPRRDSSDAVLLLIDEAHTLPALVLEELRLLSNLVRGGQTRVRLILAGHPSLEERLAMPRLDALQQRVSVRCYLVRLNGSEVKAFIRHQITVCGGDPDKIFTDEAFPAVARFTDGVPRLVNQLCDHALILACADERLPVDESLIEEAWCDLQRLPMRPVSVRNLKSTSLPGESAIEFGILGDPDGQIAQPAWDTSGDVQGVTNPASGPTDLALDAMSRQLDRAAVSSIDDNASDAAATCPREVLDNEAQVRPATNVGTNVGSGNPGGGADHVQTRAIDPFDGSFAEEEVVVIDRFADEPLGAVTTPSGNAPVHSLPKDASALAKPPTSGDSLVTSSRPAAEENSPLTVSSRLPDSPNEEVEEQLLQETLAALWSQPVYATHCMVSSDVGIVVGAPSIQSVQHVPTASH